MRITVLLFDQFETLDVFGPVEIFGRLKDLFTIRFASLHGGMIGNQHGVSHPTVSLKEVEDSTDLFLIPGGYGTRPLVDDEEWIDAIKKLPKVQPMCLRCAQALHCLRGPDCWTEGSYF